MSIKDETISKTKAKNEAIAARTAALPKVSKQVVDQLVVGPMSPLEGFGRRSARPQAGLPALAAVQRSNVSRAPLRVGSISASWSARLAHNSMT